MKKEIKQEPSITSVDFCIHTHENKDGLERLLHSIASDERYRGARIYIADSSKSLDRGYYKEVRKELGDAGLLNRLTIHQVPYKANLAVVRNFFLSATKSKYKLFLSDTDVVVEKTDVFAMMTVMEGNEAVGIVGGGIKTGEKTDMPEADGSPMEQDGVKFGKTGQINDFILFRNDIKHALRYDVNAENPSVAFCNAMKRAPYQMVVVSDVAIERPLEDKQSDDAQGTETSGKGSGSTPERNVQTGDAGNGGGKDSVPSGKDEKSKNTASSRG